MDTQSKLGRLTVADSDSVTCPHAIKKRKHSLQSSHRSEAGDRVYVCSEKSLEVLGLSPSPVLGNGVQSLTAEEPFCRKTACVTSSFSRMIVVMPPKAAALRLNVHSGVLHLLLCGFAARSPLPLPL